MYPQAGLLHCALGKVLAVRRQLEPTPGGDGEGAVEQQPAFEAGGWEFGLGVLLGRVRGLPPPYPPSPSLDYQVFKWAHQVGWCSRARWAVLVAVDGLQQPLQCRAPEPRPAVGAVAPGLGLYPIVTSQYSSTTLY